MVMERILRGEVAEGIKVDQPSLERNGSDDICHQTLFISTKQEK
jgi:hypothetical protein